MLEIGTKAPDFTLPDQNGEMRSLSDYRGKRVILYFYSKDMTSGCAKQACGFSELYPQFQEKNAVILGVSKDTPASHKKLEIQPALHTAFRCGKDRHHGLRRVEREAGKRKSVHGHYPHHLSDRRKRRDRQRV